MEKFPKNSKNRRGPNLIKNGLCNVQATITGVPGVKIRPTRA
jgi:hypothetical protein